MMICPLVFAVNIFCGTRTASYGVTDPGFVSSCSGSVLRDRALGDHRPAPRRDSQKKTLVFFFPFHQKIGLEIYKNRCPVKLCRKLDSTVSLPPVLAARNFSIGSFSPRPQNARSCRTGELFLRRPTHLKMRLRDSAKKSFRENTRISYAKMSLRLLDGGDNRTKSGSTLCESRWPFSDPIFD